jgi:hypothetical protein
MTAATSSLSVSLMQHTPCSKTRPLPSHQGRHVRKLTDGLIRRCYMKT